MHADERSPLLRMRDDERGEAPVGEASWPGDRLATFRDDPVARPAVEARLSHRELEIVRYEDGGKLLRAAGGRRRPPGLGESGLLTLASSRIGGATAHSLCDPYRLWSARSRRGLVLLLDTSGSVVGRKRAPTAALCAAGAALRALERGNAVTVVNFSSWTLHLRETRDIDAIYRSTDKTTAQTLLRKYNVTYVVVGRM